MNRHQQSYANGETRSVVTLSIRQHTFEVKLSKVDQQVQATVIQPLLARQVQTALVTYLNQDNGLWVMDSRPYSYIG